MIQERQDELREMKSISRLLDIAEMKDYLDDLEGEEMQQLSVGLQQQEHAQRVNRIKFKNQSLSQPRPPGCKREVKRYEQANSNPLLENGTHYLQGSQQDYNELYPFSENGVNFPLDLKLPIVHTPSNGKFASMSSTFHLQQEAGRCSRNEKDLPSSYRYIRGNELQSAFANRSTKSKSNVVYLRPNKSETIRELLNQMKLERSKNAKIVLNPMPEPGEEQPDSPTLFSSNQIKEMRKYKNFLPFREDERLLVQKIGEKESIWKRKFKQSWKRRKQGLQTRMSFFKSSPK